MKKLHQQIAIYIILLSLSFTTNLMAQTNEEPDSLISDKGNLELLVDRVYLAFKAYQIGKYGFNEIESDSARLARVEESRKKGWLISTQYLEKPILPVIVRGKEYVDNENYRLNLNSVPADSVMSIEIMNHPTPLSVLHGERGNGIVIKLKE